MIGHETAHTLVSEESETFRLECHSRPFGASELFASEMTQEVYYGVSGSESGEAIVRSRCAMGIGSPEIHTPSQVFQLWVSLPWRTKMSNQQGHPIGMTPPHLVAAVFLDEVSARDAIADLKLAGVRANQIGVALSDEGKRLHVLNPDAKHFPSDLEGKHSILWRVRHSIQHDVHGHEGPGLSSRQDAATANAEQPPFTEVDLTETLRGLGIAEATIQLLHHQVGAKGFLIMVDAPADADRIECILLNNRGMPRTVMVTERSKITT